MSELLSAVRIPAVRPPAAQAAAPWREDPSAALTRHFMWLRDTRMAGLPFLNDAVGVCVADCRRIEGDWLAALVTPWSIQLVLLPGGGTLWQDSAAGVRRAIALPVGELVFIGELDDHGDERGAAVVDGGNAAAGGVPAFLYCPLVSPLDHVADTAAACAIARDALAAALTAVAPATSDPPVAGQQAAAGGIAPTSPTSPTSPGRRAFLRGRI